MKRLLFAVLLVAASGLVVLVTSASAQTDVYEPVVLADSPIAYFRLDDAQCATPPCELANEV